MSKTKPGSAYNDGSGIRFLATEDAQECVHGADNQEPCAECEQRAARGSHSPLPWTDDGEKLLMDADHITLAEMSDDGPDAVDGPEGDGYVSEERAALNRALILKAVNTHAANIAALETAAKIIRTARRYFPKSIKNGDKFALELASAEIGTALHAVKEA